MLDWSILDARTLTHPLHLLMSDDYLDPNYSNDEGV